MCNNLCYSQASGKLDLVVKEKLYVDIDITLEKDSTNSNKESSLLIIPLPFELTKIHSFKSAKDVKLSILSEGQGYSIVSIISPNTDIIKFSIINGYKLRESPEGKAVFELNANFPFITKPERELFNLALTVDTVDLSIMFPKEFYDKEIGMSDFHFKKINKQKYQISSLVLNAKTGSKQWIVFPNPYKSRINIYQLIFALIAGLITLIIHFKAIRKKNFVWIFSVFILSSALVGLFIYFIITIPKPLEIMIWASAAIPHAVFGLFASIFIFVANKYQSTLTGQVTIDTHPAQISIVTLYKVEEDGAKKVIAKKHELDERGRYTFAKWQKKGIYKYIAKAKMDMSNEVESNIIEIERGNRREFRPLNLTSLEIADEQEHSAPNKV